MVSGQPTELVEYFDFFYSHTEPLLHKYLSKMRRRQRDDSDGDHPLHISKRPWKTWRPGRVLIPDRYIFPNPVQQSGIYQWFNENCHPAVPEKAI